MASGAKLKVVVNSPDEQETAYFPRRLFLWTHKHIPAESGKAFLFALACVFVAALVRGIGTLLGVTLAFASFYPAVLISSLVGGAAAGAFSVALSLAVIWWAIEAPRFGFGHLHSADFVFFLANAALIVWLTEA
jgi:hypothetical protein